MSTDSPRTFDWIPRHDERSRAFSVERIVNTEEPDIEREWVTGPIINQGAEGACVGFGWTNEFTAEPYPDPWADESIATTYAFNHYHRAREIDEFDDNTYTSGSSVLAGAKVAVERGLIGEYSWCYSTLYAKYAVMQLGPVVLGVPWYQEMYNTDEAGRVIVHHDMNNFVGGHCLTLTGYYPKKEFRYSDGRVETVERVFRWTNSWGPTYGDGGHGYITFEDLDKLLNTYGWAGEACLPSRRQKVDLERILDPSIPPREVVEEETDMTRGKHIDAAISHLNSWLAAHPNKKKQRLARAQVRIAKRALLVIPKR